MNPKYRVVVDAKNLALYSGGIAHWFEPLLQSWVSSPSSMEHYNFFVIVPIGKNLKDVNLPILPNLKIISAKWPVYLKRQLRHLVYDNWIFPKIVSRLEPQCVISPYHDVLFPKKSNGIVNILTIHDLCFLKVPKAYPWPIRFYYMWMLRRNIPRAHHVLTVSKSTRQDLIDILQLSSSSISVIPNALSEEFLNSKPLISLVEEWQAKFSLQGRKTVLYASGIEYRKNIERLILAFRLLWSRGYGVKLCITGNVNARWLSLFKGEEIELGKVQFLGYLSLSDLRLAYEAVDAVVFPSLCEGFGRSCLEAMVCGTPLACSDISVFREVAGNYPQYFDPLSVYSIANAIEDALNQDRLKPEIDAQYEIESVTEVFEKTMNELMITRSLSFNKGE